MGVAIGDLILRKPVSFAEMNGRKVAVDSFNVLYQFLSNIRGEDGNPLTDSKGRVTSHLTGLLYRTVNWVDAGIKPVFVFDGKHHSLKSKTIEARQKIRTDAAEKMVKAREEGDWEKVKQFASQSSRLTSEMVAEAKELVGLLGFPVVQAPSEGEAQASFLCQNGDVFAVVSQDFDALLFGCPRILRNFAVTGKRKLPGRNVYVDISPEMVELERVLHELNLDRQKLVWLAILVGTDFNEKFPKIGPKTALKLVKENSSFESLIAKTGFAPAFDYHEIEKIFLEPEFSSDFDLSFGEPNVEKIVQFLCQERNFSEERVRNALAKLSIKAKEKGQQSRLGNWS